MITTGDIIKITSYEKEKTNYALPRTPSLYCYGDTLELYPCEHHSYIVCNGDPTNGFCLCIVDKPDIPIGFVVLYVEGRPCFCITQVCYEPQHITLEVVGKYQGQPPIRHTIGSHVMVMHA